MTTTTTEPNVEELKRQLAASLRENEAMKKVVEHWRRESREVRAAYAGLHARYKTLTGDLGNHAKRIGALKDIIKRARGELLDLHHPEGTLGDLEKVTVHDIPATLDSTDCGVISQALEILEEA